jgi:hypothetical protein
MLYQEGEGMRHPWRIALAMTVGTMATIGSALVGLVLLQEALDRGRDVAPCQPELIRQPEPKHE